MKSIRINIVDFLYFLVIGAFLLRHQLDLNNDSLLISNQQTSSIYYSIILEMGIIYFLARFLFQIKLSYEYIILLFLMVLCAYVLFLHYRFILYNNFTLIGKFGGIFLNPGPLACFYSVCICVASAFYFKMSSKWISGILLLVVVNCLVFLSLLMSRTAWLATITSVVVYILNKDNIIFKIRNNSFIVITACLLVSTFFIHSYYAKQMSADGRFFMDNICLRKIVHSGLSGNGLGTFCCAYGEEQLRFFEGESYPKYPSEWGKCYEFKKKRIIADSPSRAFNEYLKIGVEAGPIVLLLFCLLLLYSCLLLISKHNPYGYGLLALAIISLFSYPFSFWSFRILLSLFLAVAGTICSNQIQRHFYVEIVGFLILVYLYINCFNFRSDLKVAQIKWKEIEAKYELQDEEYYENCSKIVGSMCYDPFFLYKYGLSLQESGLFNESNIILLMGSRISCDPLFWDAMGSNYENLGDTNSAEECYKHAFWMLPNRLFPIYLLAKLYYENDRKDELHAICEFADKFEAKIENGATMQFRREIEKFKEIYN